ncbi:RNA polymerase recycling motor ATPase HelR [Gordonia sp. (in: high G+C Gram-positive bacteria)]|uniref:RNA polymerase recycling motor ATPase HelR n=1 Tax=Gordonia sp. (in: high G+C Gram-positive bacteria) TaxID=84139 RepID=UPI003C783659
MTPNRTDRPDVFDLPERLASKRNPVLIADDRHHFALISDRVTTRLSELNARLDEARRSTDVRVGAGVQRDQEIRGLSSQIRRLSHFGADLCLGRLVTVDGTRTYIGRIGLTAADGTPLLVDWRTPEAAPFFAATLAEPMGLVGRRHYRWSREVIVDYWDEVFATGSSAQEWSAAESRAALDSQSSFIASLGASRSAKMTSVLGTIAADQDAAIRASSHGPFVVEGGPGTGKTVVALHRAAYLLYADPRLQGNRGGILIVGPHRPYLSYISDVLPSLGEEGVATCTLADLVPGGENFLPEVDEAVATLKSTTAMMSAIEAAVAFYEEPPTDALTIETPWCDVTVTPEDWREAFAAVGRSPIHNEVREEIWEVLLEIVVGTAGGDLRDGEEVSSSRLRGSVEEDGALRAALRRAWPMLNAEELVADLWAVPAYLRHCAPGLTTEERATLRRPEGSAFTAADLPLLDAARRRLGDPEVSTRLRRRRAEVRAQRRVRDDVVAELIAGDDNESLVSMLRAEDIQGVIVDEAGMSDGERQPLDGPFAHIVVDEAQDLTDAQWQMLLARCPSKSFTIVGDRAQSRAGFAQTWAERAARVGLTRGASDGLRRTTLTVNYRTPAEVMDRARPEILAALPDADVPESIRSSGLPVIEASVADRDQILSTWLAEHPDGTVGVIGDDSVVKVPDPDAQRVVSLTPVEAKGLEFDLVVLVGPDRFGGDIAGAVDRYVAMTRTTSQLVILSGDSHPR